MSKYVQNTKFESPAWSYSHRGYALLQSLRQLGRSKIATCMTLAVLGITMTLPAIFFLLSDDVRSLTAENSKGMSLTAYLNPAISDLEGAALASSIEKQALVTSVDFISSEEALATFQQQSEFDSVLELLNENPLPAAVVVYPERVSTSLATGSDPAAQTTETSAMMNLLADQIKAMPGVERVEFDLQWVQRLESVIALFKHAIFVLGVLLILTSLMVIGNTIRLEMLRRKREMEVTRLLGASATFVSRPFIYLGALYGLLGSLIAIAGAITIQNIINPTIQQLAQSYGTQFSLSTPPLDQIGLITGVATFLGILGSALALYWQRANLNSL